MKELKHYPTDEEKLKVFRKIIKDAKLYKNKQKRILKKKKYPILIVDLFSKIATRIFLREKIINFNESFIKTRLKYERGIIQRRFSYTNGIAISNHSKVREAE